MSTVRRDSPYQIAIYDAVKNTTQNVSVLATAGAGKTTTILKALNYIPRHHRSIFLSFSASIVKELRSKVPPHIDAATLHSKGFAMMRRFFGNRGFHVTDGAKEMPKYMKLAVSLYKQAKGSDAKLTKKEYRSAALVSDICGYARMTLTPFTKEALPQMCAYYNIEFDEQMIDYAIQLLQDATKIGSGKVIVIDFIDMIYFPAVMPEMVDIKYDAIFLDEAQDTNAAQFAMIESMLKKNGRLIAVGDDYQCIYGFSGADINAFKRIRERPNTITLPLSISYRCAKNVVAKAKEFNPEIEAYEEAREGIVREGSWDDINEDDIVLSRTTKPLIGLYFKLLEKGVRARVIGKDIEKGLIDLAEVAMSETMEGMMYNFQTMFANLEAELKELGIAKPHDHIRYRTLEEKVQVLELVLTKVNYPSQLIPALRDMFDENKQAARLMTIHKSKGLENERVFIIMKVSGVSLMPSKWARQPWENTQEQNLQFVAFTRAKGEMVLINLDDIE